MQWVWDQVLTNPATAAKTGASTRDVRALFEEVGRHFLLESGKEMAGEASAPLALTHALLHDVPSDLLQACLTQAAELLAWIHTFDAQSMVDCERGRSHASFAPSFETHAARFADTFDACGFKNPTRLADRLSPSFFSRRGDRLQLGDARPKNCVVRPDGTLCFIDLDWGTGPPLGGIAVFLVALDRLASHYPFPGIQRRLTSWQRMFVDAYARFSDRPVGDELTFFYPWTLLQLAQHCRPRPRLAPYFRWHYGRALHRYLARLAQWSPGQVAASPRELFGW